MPGKPGGRPDFVVKLLESESFGKKSCLSGSHPMTVKTTSIVMSLCIAASGLGASRLSLHHPSRGPPLGHAGTRRPR